jgi:hypothetical protein
LDPAAGTRLNLAVCEAKLGRLAIAWQHYTALESELTPNDSRRAFVEAGLRDVDARVPRVVFEAQRPLPSGLTLRVAALTITESGFGVPIPLDPGAHAVEITAPGHASGRLALTLVEGERRSVRIGPLLPVEPIEPVEPLEASGSASSRRVASPLPAASAPETSRGWTSRQAADARTTWGTIALGAGLASLVAGGVLGIGALNEKASMDRECQPGCSDEGLAAAARGTRYAIASTIAVVGGVAIGTAGAVVVFWSSEAETGRASGVQRAGMAWGGRF